MPESNDLFPLSGKMCLDRVLELSAFTLRRVLALQAPRMFLLLGAARVACFRTVAS